VFEDRSAPGDSATPDGPVPMTASPDRPRLMRWSERFLFAVAFVALGFYGFAKLEAAFYGRSLGDRLDAIAGAERAPTVLATATRTEARTTGLVGRIELPRLGVSAIVAEGVDKATLRRAVGHLPETALPGETGNVALAAHRDSFFRPLRDVVPSDRITLTTPDGVFEYVVDWTAIVEPTRTDLVGPASAPVLTLITCFPFDYIGAAPQRFVVRARQVEPTAAAAP
jgi:sortase A